MPEGVQEYESGAHTYYKVSWKSKLNGVTTVVRRDPKSAMNLAEDQRKRGFKTKLFRVEETELDF